MLSMLIYGVHSLRTLNLIRIRLVSILEFLENMTFYTTYPIHHFLHDF
jgi:hypothetical protein